MCHLKFKQALILKGRKITFLGGLDWTVLVGKEIMGKSSERVGGGEEVAGVLEAGVPFPPDQHETKFQDQFQDQLNVMLILF